MQRKVRDISIVYHGYGFDNPIEGKNKDVGHVLQHAATTAHGEALRWQAP